ncbi:MAG: hypothetical protein V1899_03045 [Planctomycetota bacterium]
MAAQTGRSIEKWVYVIVGDSANALREINVTSIGDVGLAFEAKDVTVWQDAVKNALTGQPSAPIKIAGRFDNSAAVTAPATTEAHALSGAHGVLSAICGDGLPHTLDIRFGVRHAWTTNEPQFGLARVSANGVGYACTKYTVNGTDYSAEFEVMGGTVPAWGTAALTAGS